MRYNQPRVRPGNSLLEVLIAMGVLVFFSAAYAQLSISAYEGDFEARQRSQASHIAQEGLEAVRFLALEDFDSVTDGTHGVAPTGGVFALSGASTFIGEYEREVEITTVNRDSNGAIVETGGTPDIQTKQIRSTVYWNALRGLAKQVSLLTYVTQWRAVEWVIDLLLDFQTGTQNGSVFSQDANGEVQAGDRASLYNLIELQAINSPGNTDITAIAVDTRTDILYAGGRANIGTDNELFLYDISDATNGNVTLIRSISLGADVHDIVLGDEYAFLLTDDNSAEVQAMRLSDSTIVSTYNISFLPASGTTNDLYLDTANDRLFVGGDQTGFFIFSLPELTILDVSNPASSMTSIASVEVSTDVQAVALYNNYAFLGLSDTIGELRIVNLDNTSLAATCDLVGTQSITALSIVDDRLFIGREGGLVSEFAEHTINTSNPLDCASLLLNMAGEVDMNSDDVNDIYVDAAIGTAFVSVFDSAGDIFSIDIATYDDTEFNVSATDFCESIFHVGAYVYVGCRDNGSTFHVLKGQPSVSSGFQEDIYTEGMQNSWSIASTGGNQHNTSETLLARNGTNALTIQSAISGETDLSKTVTVTASGAVELYVNSVSPWAFGIYGDDGGSHHSTTSVTNATFGTSFHTNDEEGGFTDFPQLDYDAIKAHAQANGSYINAGNSHLTLDTSDFATYSGKIIFVEFTRSNRRLRLDFDNSSAAYTFSVVMYGGDRIELQDYLNTTLTTASGSFPVLASSNDLEFDENDHMTVNGLLYTEDRFESNALSGSRRLNILGSIVAGRIDNRTERVNLVYTANYNQNPPNYFSPDYYGQQLGMRVDAGSTVSWQTGMTAAIDKDPSTWQQVVLPFSALGVSAGSIDDITITNTASTNQPTVFLDDISIESAAENGTSLTRFATYTSPAFDSGSATTNWDEIQWTATGGTVPLRIRTASTEAGLQDALWVGSDGTLSSEYTTAAGQSIQTSSSASGTRWIQWKAYFSGDGTSTPILHDVSVSYE